MEERGVWGPVLGHAILPGQGDEEGLSENGEGQPLSRRKRSRRGVGPRSPGEEGVWQGGHDQLSQAMLSSQVNWGHNTDHWVWQHSVTQAEMAEAKVTVAAERKGTGPGRAPCRKGEPEGDISQVERGCPGLAAHTKARRGAQSQLVWGRLSVKKLVVI